MTTAGYPWVGDPEHPNRKNPRNSLYACDPLGRTANEDGLGALCSTLLSLSEPSFSSIGSLPSIFEHGGNSGFKLSFQQSNGLSRLRKSRRGVHVDSGTSSRRSQNSSPNTAGSSWTETRQHNDLICDGFKYPCESLTKPILSKLHPALRTFGWPQPKLSTSIHRVVSAECDAVQRAGFEKNNNRSSINVIVDCKPACGTQCSDPHPRSSIWFTFLLFIQCRTRRHVAFIAIGCRDCQPLSCWFVPLIRTRMG